MRNKACKTENSLSSSTFFQGRLEMSLQPINTSFPNFTGTKNHVQPIPQKRRQRSSATVPSSAIFDPDTSGNDHDQRLQYPSWHDSGAVDIHHRKGRTKFQKSVGFRSEQMEQKRDQKWDNPIGCFTVCYRCQVRFFLINRLQSNYFVFQL